MAILFDYGSIHAQYMAHLFERHDQVDIAYSTNVGQYLEHQQTFTMDLDEHRKTVALQHDYFTVLFHGNGFYSFYYGFVLLSDNTR